MHQIHKCLILILIVFFHSTLNAQKYYVKYGIEDCLKCSIHLHTLSKELKGQEVNFIFPKKYKNDEKLIINQFGLKDFKYNIHFSDSLFNHFVKGKESYFIIENTDNVFLTKIKELDIEAVQTIMSQNADKNQVCFNATNSDNQFFLNKDNVVISTHSSLGR